MPEPELQYDTATHNSPAIYDTLLRPIVLDLLNDDSSTVCSLLNGCILI
ncbi:hypothetical protein TSAR_005565 [Trichomalopsis sarcophagae]|uniref:Uncharacterized protein n=1 Tax=Trichomalopsis sarcophagae TaxID=543379 RepID=A0A232EKY7_9HYME|nr:hypothetical protein TSAR_005565 [Trichomalopsis sarcophagae]